MTLLEKMPHESKVRENWLDRMARDESQLAARASHIQACERIARQRVATHNTENTCTPHI
jgi:hypothetical protein